LSLTRKAGHTRIIVQKFKDCSQRLVLNFKSVSKTKMYVLINV
jgi:hypothetical protein